MYWISSDQLVEKYRTGTFPDSETGPYIMAEAIVLAIFGIGGAGEPSAWSIIAWSLGILITVFGIYHLHEQNGGTYGNQFLSKYVCLGWIVGIRLMLLSVPVMIVVGVFVAATGGGQDNIDAGFAAFVIFFHVIYYFWLGSLIAKTNETKPDDVPKVELGP